MDNFFLGNDVVPCQGLDLGYVIAKRPPLSDFALSPTRIFKIDKAVGNCPNVTSSLASAGESSKMGEQHDRFSSASQESRKTAVICITFTVCTANATEICQPQTSLVDHVPALKRFHLMKD